MRKAIRIRVVFTGTVICKVVDFGAGARARARVGAGARARA
eukprot:COSAG03_NODE_18612_length_351_cov_1.376984_1_plen_40_part_10